MSESRQETSVVQVVFDSGMGAFSQGMQDMLANALKNADTQAKLAAKIPGAKIWLVGNLGNTLQIGIGFGKGDANIVGEALFKIIGSSIGGAAGAIVGGFLGAMTPLAGVGLWIGRIGGAVGGAYLVEDHVARGCQNFRVQGGLRITRTVERIDPRKG
ncbi:hypothetical protein [Pandoraea sp.]|uniref:hypothetical protein n=1 Tax=Pandoraea sp. TaxID=1883445 RepID=UPI0035B4A729